jgi:hypothetical protein
MTHNLQRSPLTQDFHNVDNAGTPDILRISVTAVRLQSCLEATATPGGLATSSRAQGPADPRECA